ncbi:hypothetical protein ACIGO8_10860 [Streptomyces sp. NPDC053493]|uniref:hypothetical protein n=1 Tax=Streptomyces sp. NPDC053493 TaxID=3365705 RepID=UPI0037D49C59
MVLKVVARGGREWLLTERIGAGSEGLVYAVGHDGALVAKLVPDPADPAAYRRRVERLVRQRREPRTVRLLAGTPQRVAWPLAAVRTVHADVEGYLMPDMRRAFLPFTALLTPSVRAAALPTATWATALTAAESLSRLLADLHAEDYVVGDLTPDNLWVDAAGRVGVADVDSWQFTDGRELFAGRMRTPGYTAPERIEQPGTAVPAAAVRPPAADADADAGADVGAAASRPPAPSAAGRTGERSGSVAPAPSTDVFALAVLVHQLLMGGLHPFAGHPGDGSDYLSLDDNVLRGRCRVTDRRSVVLPRAAPPGDLLPRALVALFRAAFSGPGSRPAAAEWARELRAARAPGRLARCAMRAGHLYTTERPWCPWCDQAARGVDSYPEVP